MLRFALAVLSLSTAAAAAASDNAPVDSVLQQLEQVHRFSGVSISPDARWVAWISPISAGTSTPRNEAVYLQDLQSPGSKAKRVVAGDALENSSASGIAWSPDSSQMAFLAHGDSGQDQIYILTAGKGTKARQLGMLNGYVTSLCWRPGAKQIAFLYAEKGGGAGPLAAVPAQTGVIGSDIHNQRLSTIALDSAQVRQLSPANLNIYEYDWSSAANRIAVIAAPGPADNNWWTAKLYTVDAASGSMTELYAPPADRQIAAPHWSPDGTQLAFLAGLMSDEGFDGGDIFLIPSSGGNPRNLTANLKATPTGLRWRSNEKLLYTAAQDGGGAIALFDLKSGESETLWQGPESLHEDGNYPDLSFAADNSTSAAVRSDWQHPPEVSAGRIGEWKPLTSDNATQTPRWGKAESVLWQNGPHRVQGWLLYPDHFDSAKRYPMIVEIHGGPSSERSASWPSVHFDMSVMASAGYFVFFPNPRGSYGEGEAFTRANIKDFGGGDLSDILAGIDAVEKKVPVDDARLGVTGWSYGGFMTMWTVTQTHRFRAAVAGAGIADWLSYYGENSIDQWMIPFFGESVYNDPAVYAKSSPITFIKQVKTPTLVVVGERDGECPAPQSFEFWHALKAQNVPTELVVYPGEGHSFRDPKNRLDVVNRSVDWFSQYLR